MCNKGTCNTIFFLVLQLYCSFVDCFSHAGEASSARLCCIVVLLQLYGLLYFATNVILRCWVEPVLLQMCNKGTCNTIFFLVLQLYCSFVDCFSHAGEASSARLIVSPVLFGAKCTFAPQSSKLVDTWNTYCQSDAQQFSRQDLCCCRTTSLEQSAAQSQTMWAVIRPVQAVTEDVFIRTVQPQCSVNCFNSAI